MLLTFLSKPIAWSSAFVASTSCLKTVLDFAAEFYAAWLHIIFIGLVNMLFKALEIFGYDLMDWILDQTPCPMAKVGIDRSLRGGIKLISFWGRGFFDGDMNTPVFGKCFLSPDKGIYECWKVEVFIRVIRPKQAHFATDEPVRLAFCESFFSFVRLSLHSILLYFHRSFESCFNTRSSMVGPDCK